MNPRHVSLRITDVLRSRIAKEVAERRVAVARFSQNDWIIEAIREKLDMGARHEEEAPSAAVEDEDAIGARCMRTYGLPMIQTLEGRKEFRRLSWAEREPILAAAKADMESGDPF